MTSQSAQFARPLLGAWVALVMLWLAASMANGQPDAAWESMRRQMVEREVKGSGIRDPRVIAAVEATPRHLFVPLRQRRLAYTDMALPIGEGQTISPPFIVAYMTEQLEVAATDKVLEIGTGSGYQAAILSPLVAEVYSIEISKALARRSAKVLRQLGYDNVHSKQGDGFVGWPEFAPFDKIIVTCSPEEIPQALIDQLREGGRLVIPLGERFQQSLCLFVKTGGKLHRQDLEATFFVPMTGEAEALRSNTSDVAFTELVNSSFEEANEHHQPVGWYYVRQAEVVADASAKQGAHVLRLSNRDRGRHAQVLQAVGIDGRRTSQIAMQLAVRTQDVQPGQSEEQLPRLQLTFYDKNRKAVATERLGPWRGTSTWKHEQTLIDVPEPARLAVLMIGMFGAVGNVDFDAIVMEAKQE